MTESTNDNPSAAPKQSSSNIWVLGLTSFIAFVVVVVGLLTWLPTASYLSGKEFSPHTFQTRDFFYYRIPGTQIRLISTRYSPIVTTPGASTALLKHLQNTTQQSIQWDLAQASQGGATQLHPPMVLLGALEVKNRSYSYQWDDWSSNNPDRAATLWPMVQKLALDGRYLLIPELLDAAWDARTPKDIEASFKKLISVE